MLKWLIKLFRRTSEIHPFIPQIEPQNSGQIMTTLPQLFLDSQNIALEIEHIDLLIDSALDSHDFIVLGALQERRNTIKLHLAAIQQATRDKATKIKP